MLLKNSLQENNIKKVGIVERINKGAETLKKLKGVKEIKKTELKNLN